jgi:hypothetical protein
MVEVEAVMTDETVTNAYTMDRLRSAIAAARSRVYGNDCAAGISPTLNSTMDVILEAEARLAGTRETYSLEWLTDTLEKRS